MASTARIESTHHGRLQLVRVAGYIDRAAWRRIAALANGCRVAAFALAVDSDGACWPCPEAHKAIEADQQLHRRAVTLSFIDEAFGASYLLAASCSSVLASPAASVGRFEFDNDTERGVFAMLAGDARPWLDARPAWLDTCRSRAVNGEQAETLRMVDGLAPSIESLLAGLFAKNDAGKFECRVREVNSSFVLID